MNNIENASRVLGLRRERSHGRFQKSGGNHTVTKFHLRGRRVVKCADYKIGKFD